MSEMPKRLKNNNLIYRGAITSHHIDQNKFDHLQRMDGASLSDWPTCAANASSFVTRFREDILATNLE